MSLEDVLADAFLNFLMDRQVLDEGTAREVLERQQAGIPPLGRIALQERMLSVHQVHRILDTQMESGLSVDRQAVALGFLQEEDLAALLAAQLAARPTLGAVLLEMGLVQAVELDHLKQAFLDLTGALIC